MERVFDAVPEELAAVNEFVEEILTDQKCSAIVRMRIDLMVEEIFVNVASYAYGDKQGKATVRGEVTDGVLKLSFIDSGVPYNPLAHTDPDITLNVEDRDIGGLGIFLVKKNADKVEYEFADGQNILTIYKTLG